MTSALCCVAGATTTARLLAPRRSPAVSRRCVAAAPTASIINNRSSNQSPAASAAASDGLKQSSPLPTPLHSRRAAAASLSLAAAALLQAVTNPSPARADTECTSCSNSNSSLQPGDREFLTAPSGARYTDIIKGEGPTPVRGQTVVLEWVGYTAGYQGKKIESSRQTDTPYTFVVGQGQAIAAFEEAVLGMKQGGMRRIEIPGELEEKLAYSRDAALRYNVGPVPTTFGGRRALDFVLDNNTLKDFNRTLLFDIRLSAIRK